jgi:hypothetical protein
MKKLIISPKTVCLLLSLAVFSIMISGCKPKPNPANLVGKWKAEFTSKIATNTVMQIDEGAANVISITTETNGAASLEMAAIQNAQSPKTETITGSWEQVGDFFILERTNGGFVALRISSEVTTNQLTVVARTGQTIQFNRIP